MSTKAQIGYGIALSNSSTSGGTYTAIAEILEITPPGPSVESVKVYRSDNTSPVAEKVPSWTENSDTEATITYAPTQRTALEALVAVPSFWKVTYPKVAGQASTGDVDAFAGFLSKLGKETPIKDMMKCKISITVNGGITYTVGS